MGRGNESFVCGIRVARPRWLPCPYMEKKHLKNLLWNQWTDFHETWYVVWGTWGGGGGGGGGWGIIVCTKDDPGLTLTYFTARSNLVT